MHVMLQVLLDYSKLCQVSSTGSVNDQIIAYKAYKAQGLSAWGM